MVYVDAHIMVTCSFEICRAGLSCTSMFVTIVYDT